MDNSDRYGRQIGIAGWGESAQKKIAQARICIAGVGGLGSPVTMYLAAAGVGTLVLCDYQTIELSNLNRQILYDTKDIGESKLQCAKNRLNALNPDVVIETVDEPLSDQTDESHFAADLIVDCLDNFKTRFVLNRYSVAHGVPLLHAGIHSWYGQLALLAPPESACLECFVDNSTVTDPPPVLGSTAGVVGSLQATIALKYIAGIGADIGKLVTVDLRTMGFDSFDVERDKDCPACAHQ